MPWLVVTGGGSWNHAGEPYKPGIHEVSRETADAARSSRVGSLFVSELEPEIMTTPDKGEPLSLKDIRVGTNQGVRVQGQAPVEETIADSSGRIFEFSCPHCDKALASSGSLARHIEMNHELLPA